MNNINKNNLPKGWRKVKLGEITKVFGGGTPSTSNPNYWNGNIPWLTPAEVVALRGNRFIEKTDRYITEEGLRHSSAKLIPAYSLLLTSRATIGEVVINKIPMATNQGFINIIPDKIDLMFLFYWLRMKKNYLNKMAVGSTFNELSKSVFKKIEIIYPEDINEQKRIAEIFSAFDDKIELNNKIIKTLEEMASAIFKEWFEKNSKSKNQNTKWIKAEKIFIFEKGIEPGSRYYSEFKKEGYIPFYRVRDLDKDGEVDVYIPKEIANGKICNEDDVLLSLDATVGRVKIGCSGAFSSGIRKVYSRDGFIKNSFIYFWLKTPYVQNIILEHASGTTILHAGNAIKYIEFPFNLEIIDKIQKVIDPIFNKILKLKAENQKLSALRDLLLPKLMSGEIRV